MVNRHRGEVEAELGGRRYTLCLTLGALAELEAAFAADDLGALAARFAQGRLSARDATRLIGAGLRGAGHTLSDAEVAAMPVAGGAAGYAALVTDLLQATFAPHDPIPPDATAAGVGRTSPAGDTHHG